MSARENFVPTCHAERSAREHSSSGSGARQRPLQSHYIFW
jgi:hypothetical protein